MLTLRETALVLDWLDQARSGQTARQVSTIAPELVNLLFKADPNGRWADRRLPTFFQTAQG
jgi:hypothetical protein